MSQDDVESLIARMLTGECRWPHPDGEVWMRVPSVAIEHGVESLLWTLLPEVPAATATRTALTTIARAAVARDVFVQRELVKIANALAEGGVPALFTKGAALAYTVYPEPWMRPRTDTDILVRSRDIAAASRLLESCGYVRSDATNTGAFVSHQIGFERTDAHVRHVIDLHWKVVNPHMLADALTFEDLWRSARPAPALGPAARVPGAVESIAIASLHRLAHHQRHDRLIWLYDLRLLSASLDETGWRVLRDFACARQIAGLCLDGLRAARDRVGGTLPVDVETELAAAVASEPSRTYLERDMSKSDVLLSDLQMLDTWSARLRLVREHVFPPAAFIQQRYGTRARLLLPALYLHRLLSGASRWVK